MDIFVKGKGDVRLDKRSFVGQGGEGQVWAKGGIAYKVYFDCSKMIPAGKIDELSVLTDPDIIRPLDVLMDKKNRPIGYTMRHVKNTVALCQMFTKAFKERNQLTQEMLLELIFKMQTSIKHIHQAGILIVDLNEVNFLVDKHFQHVFFIDTDSYKTPSYPPTAIMESIRDRHSSSFSNLTDWFSFGVVSFQMLIGIHPYKGGHKTIKGIDARMQQNISVFNPDVSMPAVCAPLYCIPEQLKGWYKAVFEDGKRLPPPLLLGAAIEIQMTPRHITNTDNLDINTVRVCEDAVVYYGLFFGKEVVATKKAVYVWPKKTIRYSSRAVFGCTPKYNHIISARIRDGKIRLDDLDTGVQLETNIGGTGVFAYDGRIYVKNGQDLYEIETIELGENNIKVSPKVVANVMEQATAIHDGVAIQNILGTSYAVVCPETGRSYQVALEELNGYRIVDAKFQNGVLILVGNKASKYDKFIFRFAKDYESYDLRKIEDITFSSGVNFVTLDSGICAHLTEDEKLELFFNKKGSTDMKVLDEPLLAGVRLFSNGAKVLFATGKEVYSVTMK